jgi:uncharacterized protein
MSSRLPETVDPWRASSQDARYSGTVALSELPRIRDAVSVCEGQAEFSLEFGRDEKKRPLIKGYVKADLKLLCQRCLDHLVLPVDATLDLAVIEVPEEAERLPEETDPVWVEDGLLRLMDLVEEELLLAIPQIPRHPTGQCEMNWANPEFADDGAPVENEGKSDKPNPFEVLSGLKSDKQH